MATKQILRAKKGQWVHFDLPQEAAGIVGARKQADDAGAWRTRSDLYCGIHQDPAHTPEGMALLPERIMLVREDGRNVRTVVRDKDDMAIVDLWVMPEGTDPKLARMFKMSGCIGVALDTELVEYKEDCPPGRRPDVHPKDMRRPMLTPWELARLHASQQKPSLVHGVDLPPGDKAEGGKGDHDTKSTDIKE